MEFKLNINDTYKNFNNIDEWGCAFVFDENDGVEYNYCRDNNEDYSAIYYFASDEYLSTNYDEFVHYEIDFNNENWQLELKREMEKVLKHFQQKHLTNN